MQHMADIKAAVGNNIRRPHVNFYAAEDKWSASCVYQVLTLQREDSPKEI